MKLCAALFLCLIGTAAMAYPSKTDFNFQRELARALLGEPEPRTPGMTERDADFEEMMRRVNRGEINLNDAVDQLRAKWDRVPRSMSTEFPYHKEKFDLEWPGPKPTPGRYKGN